MIGYIGLAVVAAWQFVTATISIRAIFSRPDRDVNASDGDWGRTLVVLCLRGNDPSLIDALRGLMSQDYVDYKLRIVVDSFSDPAWRSIEASGVDQWSRSRVEVLRDPPQTCGLKNAALLQVLDDLDEDVKFLALVDADTIAHPSWLRELISPLCDPSVGMTTGIRWYHPERCSMAALTRLTWNAAATTQMIGFQIPWGGSLAISLCAIDPQSLRNLWRRGLCEDTMLTSYLKSTGRQQKFVPSIIMINREDCGMRDLMRWIRRQLIVARLYHPSWTLTVVHGIASALIPLGVLALIAWQIATGQFAIAWQLAIAMLVYQVSMVVVLVFGLIVVQNRLPTSQRDGVWLSTTALIRLPIAVVLIQFLYPVLLLQAAFAGKVDWRAMSYRIQPDGSVVHDGHRPYQTELEAASMHSL